jgi:sugar/nucleoside kinase (ribokinase family)
MSRKDAQGPGTPGRLVFAGDVYCDLVFVGADVPESGGETFANRFLIAPGGVANRAVAAARTGATTSLVSALGDDPLGQYVRSQLESEDGLDISLLRSVPGYQSPVSVALSGPEDRRFITYLEPHDPWGSGEHPDDVFAIHVSATAGSSAWVTRLRDAGALVVAGVGWDPTGEWSPALLSELSSVDVFVPNHVEAMAYARAPDPEAAAKILAERVPLVVVTRGRHGVIAIDSARNVMAEVPGIPVTAVDPTGAGDVFVATFMSALRQDWDLRSCLRFANLCAAYSVTGPGGATTAPRPGDLPAFIEAHCPGGDWDFLSGLGAVRLAEPEISGAVQKFASDFQVTGMCGGLLNYMQYDHAHARNFIAPVLAARHVRQADPRQYLVGLLTPAAVVAEHLGRRAITGEGHLRVIRRPALIPRKVRIRPVDHLLEPVPLHVPEVLHHSRNRPAGGNDRRVPRILVQPLDNGAHRGPLILQRFKKILPDVPVTVRHAPSFLAALRVGRKRGC